MKRKHKKILTSVVLTLLVISTLLSTFSVFASADVAPGILGPNDPPYLYYANGQDPNGRGSSLWGHYKVRDYQQIVFGLIGRENVSSPWFLVPYVLDPDSTFQSSFVNPYNDIVRNNGASGLANSRARVDIICSNTFETRIAYLSDSASADSRFKFCLQIRVKNTASWSSVYEWLPLYNIFVEYIGTNGTSVTEDPIDPPQFGDSTEGTDYAIFSQGIVRYSSTQSFTYPYIDLGSLMAIPDGYDGEANPEGINIVIQQYFYNPKATAGYPEGVLNGSDYLNNLYDPIAAQLPYTSYGFKFWFETDGEAIGKAYEEGQKFGYSSGYAKGKSDGVKVGENYNAVDGIIALAQVPGAFISGMLDFNVFGINLANTVKVIFTVAVIIFLIVLILKFVL